MHRAFLFTSILTTVLIVETCGLSANATTCANADISVQNRSFPTERIVGGCKVVGLDYYYNDEWKKDSKGKLIQYHYIWEDTTNSGYSEVGNVIKGLGAQLGELHTAPTVDKLNKFSIYIIVDPDTPKETAHPHYIDQNAIAAITNWVRAGGILMIMENDKGNAEFTHTNMLAEKFGIHFNEVSRNDVVGKNYNQGAFTNLPDHPIFNGVTKIFMKGISTLDLKPPAEVILRDKGDNIMAYARYGKGGVFAVGDPWFYNEYIGHRYLPSDFQNKEAATNLFTWLLGMAEMK